MARPKITERERIQSDTRQLLLDAAAQEFAREGYVGANINRISQAAGFAKGTIYNYFPSKRGLMLALIDEIAAEHLDFIQQPILDEEQPGRRLERFFQAGFAFVSTHLAKARAIVTTLYGPDEEFKRAMFEAYQPMFQLVGRDIVATGVEQGVFRPVDPETMSVMLMTIYLGAGSQVDEQGRPWLDPNQVASFTWHALRKGG